MKKQARWAPSPDDAMSLAAIRWFACVIETYSIELYATNPSTYKHTEKILRDAVRKLGLQRLKVGAGLTEDDCPPGYRMCDGICKPSCEPEAPEETQASSYLASKTVRSKR